jgi:hypothetical protein
MSCPCYRIHTYILSFSPLEYRKYSQNISSYFFALQGYVVGAGYEEVVLADTLESATITLRGMLAAQGQMKHCFC